MDGRPPGEQRVLEAIEEGPSPQPSPAGRGGAGADERVLADMVRRLVEELEPERIYLFGSRARGDANEDSDYDLLVVVKGRVGEGHAMERRASAASRGLEVSAQVVIFTTGYYQWMLGAAASLPATVQREGRLLYAREDARAHLTREWLTRADGFLRTAERALDAPHALWEPAAVDCFLAAEQALKGLLAWRDVPFRKPRDLVDLLRQCAAHDSSVAALEPAARLLRDFAPDPRYPGPAREVDAQLAAQSVRAARDILHFVAARVPAEAHP